MNTENKTLVSKFVENFKKLKDDANKQALVKKHVTTHYAPILNKKNVLEIILDGCVENGKSGKFINMMKSKVNFIGAILILYTDLQIDKTVENKETGEMLPDIFTAYDSLKESGAFDMLLNEIGDDLNELISVQDQIFSTWHNEHASISAYISNLAEKVGMIFSAGLGKELGSITEVFNELPVEEKKNFFSMIKGGLNK